MSSIDSLDELREMSNVAIACQIFKPDEYLRQFSVAVFMNDDVTGEDLYLLIIYKTKNENKTITQKQVAFGRVLMSGTSLK